MSVARSIEVVVPDGISDPLRASGGNTYDRRLCEELGNHGWAVQLREVPGPWPWANAESRAALSSALAAAPEDSTVVVDGLVASACPEELVPAARRLQTVLLVHLPVGVGVDGVDREREAAVVRAAAAVITTSDWTRRWLLHAYGLQPERVHVAHPGVDPARPVEGSVEGGHLLCVGAVSSGKGQDALVAALGGLVEADWRCDCIGPLDRAPDFVATLRQDIRDSGLQGRVRLVGPRTGADLDAAYADADLLVLASRIETYGMVVTEALARGLPVLAFDVGGVAEALGMTAAGTRPGVLVPSNDVAALTEALRRWLDDASLRRRLRGAAAERRTRLTGWGDTADLVARVLEAVAA